MPPNRPSRIHIDGRQSRLRLSERAFSASREPVASREDFNALANRVAALAERLVLSLSDPGVIIFLIQNLSRNCGRERFKWHRLGFK
jgi:hypothetical protein